VRRRCTRAAWPPQQAQLVALSAPTATSRAPASPSPAISHRGLRRLTQRPMACRLGCRGSECRGSRGCRYAGGKRASGPCGSRHGGVWQGPPPRWPDDAAANVGHPRPGPGETNPVPAPPYQSHSAIPPAPRPALLRRTGDRCGVVTFQHGLLLDDRRHDLLAAVGPRYARGIWHDGGRSHGPRSPRTTRELETSLQNWRPNGKRLVSAATFYAVPRRGTRNDLRVTVCAGQAH
jgi:hypothetical protein